MNFQILKRGGSADSKSSKKGKPEKEKEKDKEKEKVEKMREKKNPKRNSESALPDGSGAGTAEPPKKTRKSADSSLSPVTQNRKREGQTTSAPSIEPQPPAVRQFELHPSIIFFYRFFKFRNFRKTASLCRRSTTRQLSMRSSRKTKNALFEICWGNR